MKTYKALAPLEHACHVQQVLDALPIGVFIVDSDGSVLHGNDAGEKIWGGALPSKVSNFAYYKDRWLSAGQHAEAAEPAKPAAACALRNDPISIDEEIDITCPDGARKIILQSALPLFDDRHCLVGGVVVNQDITRRQCPEAKSRAQAEILAKVADGMLIADTKKAEETRQFFAQIVQSTDDAIIGCALDGTILIWNPAAEVIYGYTGEEVCGRSIEILTPAGTGNEPAEIMGRALQGQGLKNFETRLMHKNGSVVDVSVTVSPIRDAAHNIIGVAKIVRDITSSKRNEAELVYRTTHDALTRLPNRILLEDRLQQAIVRAQRDKNIVAVIVIDLDRFKVVNNGIGREGGDRLLRQISKRISGVFRASDTVARQGSDEFVVVAERIDSELAASQLTQRLMATMAQPFLVDNAQFYASCSIGIGLYPKDGLAASGLLVNANAAMHRAQELGGNNFQFYTPTMNERARERLEIENALHKGLEREEFLLHYQPQVDLLTGAVVGVEALLRWQHPELGLVAPGKFIGIAEETGLIVPIGAWVLRSACAQVKAWQRGGFGNLRVAVNLSARQFAEADLLGLIVNTLDETGLAAEFLDIELTESLVMTDMERVISILHELRALGVQISIDDFGTGYSSLSYLKKFPVDVLKIDRSFVKEITLQTKDAAITDAIISLAHGLGIRVIAEGVETEAQCEFLSSSMCDELQGFLFSEALSAANMAALLVEERRLPEHLLRLHKPPRKLLLVDDEPNILNALKRLMRSDGYQILTAPSGKEGLELLTQHDIDVIVSDQRMPGMTGVDFLRTVKTMYPETVRIVLSGFTELQSVTDAVNEGAIYKFLTKPWDDKQLRKHIAEAFEHKEMADENRRLNLEVLAANQGLAKANRQLEELLRHKQQQIKSREVSLDIVREALQHVPQPVIGLDDDDIVAFVNVAAQELFCDAGPILGNEATQLMPELFQHLKGDGEGEICRIQLKGKWFELTSRSMGNDSQSRGKVIMLTLAA